MTITINGHVLVHETSQSLADLRVETWARGIGAEEFIAAERTNSQGAFLIQLGCGEGRLQLSTHYF